MRILAILLILAALGALGYLVYVHVILDQQLSSGSPSVTNGNDNGGSDGPTPGNGNEGENGQPNGEEGGNDQSSDSDDFWDPEWVDPQIVGMPEVWRNPRDGAEYVLVPGGVFTRGSNTNFGNGRERPKQQIFVSSFYIARHAVSRQQFERFIDAGGYIDRDRFGEDYWTEGGLRFLESTGVTGPATWDREDAPYPVAPRHPVTGISWYEAHAFARFVGGRLPREVEWEKAARGTDGREYPWGDEWQLDACNWRDIPPDSPDQFRHEVRGRFDGYADLAPVDAFEEFASPYGAVQMAGNTFEWCQDWLDLEFYRSIARGDRRQRANPRLDIQNYHQAIDQGLRYRVLRGGAYDRSPTFARAAFRHGSQPYDRDHATGMRVVIDIRRVRLMMQD